MAYIYTTLRDVTQHCIKVADLCEATWTVDSVLYLLAGDIRELHLETQSKTPTHRCRSRSCK